MADQPGYLVVGDPARPFIGRAVFRTLIAAGVFELFAYVAKWVNPLYVHTPWMNDPYDTAVSFTVFFVPLVVGFSLIRIPLCRRNQPLPIQRARDLLRGSVLVIATALITLLADWISVAVRSNRANWDDATGVAIGLLALTSIVVVQAAVDVRRAFSELPGSSLDAPASDWLGDFLLTAMQRSGWLGPGRRTGDRLLRWLDRQVVTLIRRHPLLTAATAAAGFGIAFAGAQAFGEGIPLGQVFLIYFGVAAGAMYAFTVAGGTYLGLVRSDRRAQGARRRVIDAVVTGCAALPVAIAFRYALWSAAGAHGEGLGQIWVLLLLAFTSIFVIVFAVESLARLHGPPKALHT
jgi:hypothetical protein